MGSLKKSFFPFLGKLLKYGSIIGAIIALVKYLKSRSPIAPAPGDIVYRPDPREGAEKNQRIANSILDKLRRKK